MSHYIGDFLGLPNSLVGMSSHNQLSDYDKNKSKLDSANRQILQSEIKTGYLSTLQAQESQHNNLIKAQSLVNNSINDLASKVDMRMRAVTEQMSLVNTGIDKLAEIMMIPDFEKERLHYYSEGLKYLGQSFGNVKRYVDALEFFKKAAGLNKRDFLVQHEIGKIHLYNSSTLDIGVAIKSLLVSFEYAKDEAPNVGSEVAQHLAFANYLNGELKNAIKYGKLSFELDNTRLEALYICGEAQIVLGDIKTGIETLNTLINIDSSYLGLIKSNSNIYEVAEVIDFVEVIETKFEKNSLSGDLDSLVRLKGSTVKKRLETKEEIERDFLLRKLKVIGKTIQWYDEFVTNWGEYKANKMVDIPYFIEMGKEDQEEAVNENDEWLENHNRNQIKGYVIAITVAVVGLYWLNNLIFN